MVNYFKQLNYTLGDEDASFEMHALRQHAGHVIAVADCGSRLVPLLAKQPRKLTCVDISPLQLAISKLRLSLLAHVDHPTYCAFLGYQEGISPAQRQQLFAQLPLDEASRATLEAMLASINWDGPVYYGKFEQMLLTLSRITRLITGKRAAGIFACTTLEEQLAYYKTQFPHWRWKWVLRLLGNSTALNSLLYKGDFPKKNTPGSYLETYSQIFERLFTTARARESFFLQMIFLGKIAYPEGLPIECDPEVFQQAKAALAQCEIAYVEGDIFSAVAQHDDVDFLSLSDVPSFIDDAQAHACLQAVKKHCAKEGVVVVRGHVRLVKPDLRGFRDISHLYDKWAQRESTQLWTINTYQLA